MRTLHTYITFIHMHSQPNWYIGFSGYGQRRSNRFLGSRGL